MQESDVRLVQRCLRGDARAWEALVQTYVSKIYNMAYRYTRRFDVAEELTQEAFLKIYQNLSSFRPESGPFRNWIMRVSRNLIIDHYRATRWDKRVAGSEELEMLDFEHPSHQADPLETVERKERATFLMEAMDQLTPELKEAVLLRDIEELTYQEIAQTLEIPEGTVKSRINRGRIELAKVLRKNQRDRL